MFYTVSLAAALVCLWLTGSFVFEALGGDVFWVSGARAGWGQVLLMLMNTTTFTLVALLERRR